MRIFQDSCHGNLPNQLYRDFPRVVVSSSPGWSLPLPSTSSEEGFFLTENGHTLITKRITPIKAVQLSALKYPLSF